MARKQSRAELEKSHAVLSHENHLLYRALRAVMADETQMVGQFTFDGVTVKMRLYDACGAMSGSVLVSQHFKTGQSPDHAVYGLDEHYQHFFVRIGNSEYHNQMYNLLGKARGMRDAALKAVK